MRILLTNDDGIGAFGLNALREALEPVADLYVVAPERERSATGHAITMHKPLHPKPVSYAGSGTHGWRINGTPADCAKLGVEALLPEPPDLLLSGLNHGSNLGRDVFYSGTVSAAMEGMFLGIPSIALSVAGPGEASFLWAAAFVRWWLTGPAFAPPGPGVFYNVNFPDWARGVPSRLSTVRLGQRQYSNDFHRRLDPRGQEYFWLAGSPLDVTDEPDTDVGALAAGHITLTPLRMDVTAHDLLAKGPQFDVPAGILEEPGQAKPGR